jgi:hypothetical protein
MILKIIKEVTFMIFDNPVFVNGGDNE